MKKIRFPLYSLIALAIFAILFLLGAVANHFVYHGKIYFYTGLPSFTIHDFKTVILFAELILGISGISVFLFANLKRKWLCVAITVLLALISSITGLVLLALTLAWSPDSYVELLSDDVQHQIVIAEDCYLFSIYGGDVYEKTSPFTMKKLTKYEADIDFYTPFSDGKYSVTWNKENFELFYDSNGDGELDRKMIVAYLP